MGRYLVNTDYYFIYNNETFWNDNEFIVVESDERPQNPVDIHKALAEKNNIPWEEWGKVHIEYVDINNVTDCTIPLEGEYEVRIAWSFDSEDRTLPIEEFYDKASDMGNVCTLPMFINNFVYKYTMVTYRIVLVGLNSDEVIELPRGSYLRIYAGLITDNVDENNPTITRELLPELLSFLEDKGYLSLKETGKDLDDLVDEFEDLKEY